MVYISQNMVYINQKKDHKNNEFTAKKHFVDLNIKHIKNESFTVTWTNCMKFTNENYISKKDLHHKKN